MSAFANTQIGRLQAGRSSMFERWLKRLGVLSGLLVIAIPILGYRRYGMKPGGRTLSEDAIPITWRRMLAALLGYTLGGYLLWRPLPLSFSKRVHRFIILVGSAMYFPGICLYLWGYRHLGAQFSPSSIRAASLYKDHRMVTTGPYGILRHPMYLGVMAASLGALLIYRTWAMLIYSLSSFVVIARARNEERLLSDAFGEEWENYRQEVPAWFPRLEGLSR
jgi:protein-S-isoprenylcysteine O-methyltransferase Ste14